MNIWSNFLVDICIQNTILMLANFGTGIWSRVPGIGPGFYSFPKMIFNENQYLLSSVLWKPIILVRAERKTRKFVTSKIISHAFSNKSNPSHEFAGDRKNLLAWRCFHNWHMYVSMTWKQQIEWPIFRVLPLIFLKWCNFLCLFIFSACRPIVGSVCLFYIFLLLFSNKMKSLFLFFGETKQFNHAHW